METRRDEITTAVAVFELAQIIPLPRIARSNCAENGQRAQAIKMYSHGPSGEYVDRIRSKWMLRVPSGRMEGKTRANGTSSSEPPCRRECSGAKVKAVHICNFRE